MTTNATSEAAGDDEGADDARGRPAVGVRLDEAVRQREQPDRRRREAGQVETRVRLVARLVDEEVAGGDPEDADRDVHEEDPAPFEMLCDQPADERPDREREGGDTGPDADRRPTLTGWKVAAMIESVAGFMSAAPAPCSTRAPMSISDESARPHRSDAIVKTTIPSTKMRRRPYASATLPPDEHQRGERQRVAGHDPLELGEVGAEVALDRRQRDVHDGVVEHDHEQAEGDGGQRHPLAVLLCEDPSPHALGD